VVAAGGHVLLQSLPLSDTFVAFALPDAPAGTSAQGKTDAR